MARIRINTFRFYLSITSLLQGLLVLALVLVSIFRLSGVREQGIHIMRTVQPTQTWTEKLRADVTATSDLLMHYFATGDTEFRQASEELWEEEIAEAIGKLDGFYANWKSPEYRTVWTEIKYKLSKLQKLQARALEQDEIQNQQALLTSKALPVFQDVNGQMLYFFDLVREDVSASGEWLLSEIYGFLYTEGIAFIIIAIMLWLIFRLLNHKVRIMLNRIEQPITILSEGNLPDDIETSKDELQNLLERIRDLSVNLRGVKNFALEVGKGNFDTELSVFDGQGEIGTSLVEMRESLRKVDEQDKQRDWINSGYNKYGELIRKYGDNLQQLTEELIKNLVQFLEANQGGFFVIDNQAIERGKEQEQSMSLRATYAYDRQKFEERTVLKGEGLLGQAWQEKDLMVLDKVPDNYLYISSGLGYATPNHLVLVPLVTNNEVQGMLEIASFSPFASHQLNFLKGLGETIAAAINTVKVNDNTRKLLDDSQELTEQMRAQEEEMRQNMEELQATQEEMTRGANEAEAKVNRLNTILNSTADPVITVTANGIIDAFNYAAESLFGYNANEIIEHNIGILLPEEKVIRRELVETSNSPVERARVNTRRRMDGIRKGGKRFLAEVAVKDTFYNGEKYFTVLVRDVSEEVGQLEELSQNNTKLQIELERALAEKDRLDQSQREIRLRQLALDRSALLLDLDPEGTITYANDLMLDTLEMGEKDLLERPLQELLASRDTNPNFDTLWQQVLSHTNVLQRDLEFTGADNKRVWARCAFTLLKEEDGEVKKVMVVAHDITTQMELLHTTQEEVKRLQQAGIDPEGAGLDPETQQKLVELRKLQQEVQENLLEVMQRNEVRMRDAIDLQEATWKKKK